MARSGSNDRRTANGFMQRQAGPDALRRSATAAMLKSWRKSAPRITEPRAYATRRTRAAFRRAALSAGCRLAARGKAGKRGNDAPDRKVSFAIAASHTNSRVQAGRELISDAEDRCPFEATGPDSGGSYEAAAAEISAIFKRKLAGLRRRLPRHEIPAAVRALVAERKAALKALREERARGRHARKSAYRMQAQPSNS